MRLSLYKCDCCSAEHRNTKEFNLTIHINNILEYSRHHLCEVCEKEVLGLLTFQELRRKTNEGIEK